MKTSIAIDHEKLADFCRRWKITELALFGSALREDFRPDSDVDVLVTFAPDARCGLLGLVRAQSELSEIFGRRVDFVDRASVEHSENWIRRRAILATAQTIYVAR